MLNMIRADEARRETNSARPDREYAEADTLADSAIHWAIHNAEGRTDARIRTYAKYGRSELSVKFAPSATDGHGIGNSFYNDLYANSNAKVADAICSIIYGRDQDFISPLQTARLLNYYSTQLAKFVTDLEKLGYTVEVGQGEGHEGNATDDCNTIVVKW